jgi:hypothetical protein
LRQALWQRGDSREKATMNAKSENGDRDERTVSATLSSNELTKGNIARDLEIGA